MSTDYRVKFAGYSNQRNEQNAKPFHPLSNLYRQADGRKYHDGEIAFVGPDLDQSAIFDDVHSFWLEFYGELSSVLDREAWADPIRIKALENLAISTGHEWYMAFIGDVPDQLSPTGVHSLDDEISEQYILKYDLPTAIIAADTSDQIGFGSYGDRLLVEYPTELMKEVLKMHLTNIHPGAPFEGYLMKPGRIQTHIDWNAKPRTDTLFRSVLDEVDLLFYTWPSEHRHFVFLTSKYTETQMGEMLNIELLSRMAKQIGEKSQPDL